MSGSQGTKNGLVPWLLTPALLVGLALRGAEAARPAPRPAVAAAVGVGARGLHADGLVADRRPRHPLEDLTLVLRRHLDDRVPVVDVDRPDRPAGDVRLVRDRPDDVGRPHAAAPAR